MADEFEKMGENLRAKTGKGLDEWVATARATGIAGHMATSNPNMGLATAMPI